MVCTVLGRNPATGPNRAGGGCRYEKNIHGIFESALSREYKSEKKGLPNKSFHPDINANNLSAR